MAQDMTMGTGTAEQGLGKTCGFWGKGLEGRGRGLENHTLENTLPLKGFWEGYEGYERV